MDVSQWAKKWNVSNEALDELEQLWTRADTPISSAKRETDIQNLVRIEATMCGSRLWRNNLGACKTDTGSFIRYGLANDSKVVNNNLKSADLIGIQPVLITPDHVGLVIGQFLSREIKSRAWKFSNSPHEIAQRNWIALIQNLGGDACFATGVGTLHRKGRTLG